MAGGTLIEITGRDAREFLQGLVSNDLARLERGLVYAALLTPQGKYLADFFLLRHGAGLLMDIAPALAGPTLRRLGLYKLRADVTLGESPLKVTRHAELVPGALADPRHPALGYRLYGSEIAEPPQDWDAIRVEHCIPESGIELIPDDSYILECGFERLQGVDFRKGCFVGQEVTARMKHKTELRKGLLTVAVTGDAVPGTPVMAGDKPAGVLFTRAGDRAIAWLRFDRATGDLHAGAARIGADPPV